MRLFVICTSLALSQFSACAQDTVSVTRDVSYLGVDRDEKLDLYLPADIDSAERRPAILIIHGGGWVKGDKGAKREINIGTTLASAAYVCASINYHLGDATRDSFPEKLASAFPANLHDCKTAVRWLRKHADEYRIHPDRIGVIGGSAGGHLTAMVGVTNPEDGLEPDGPYAEYSSRVQAIVPMYGPADLEHRARERNLWESLSPQQRRTCTMGSPVTYADAHDPPALILHGTADTTVELAQSRRLAAAFQHAGIPHHLEIIEGAPHSFHLQPKQRDLRPMVTEFFDRHLRK